MIPNDYTSKIMSILSVKNLAFLIIALLLSCTGGDPLSHGGSGTGVGNGTVLVGKALTADSLPVQSAIVRLRTDMYLADTSGKTETARNDTFATAYTDSQGVFKIDSVRHARIYCIEILDTNREEHSGVFYRLDLSLDTTSDTIHLPTKVVRPVKNINGTIVLNDLPQNAYIQFYGVERVGRADSNGVFKIEQLPPPVDCEKNECKYRLKITVVKRDNSVEVYKSELEVKFDSNQNVIEVEFELKDDNK
jgi:hypothetical protein